MNTTINHLTSGLSLFSALILSSCAMPSGTHDAIERAGSYGGNTSSAASDSYPRITHGYDGTEAPTYRAPNSSSAYGQLSRINSTGSWGGN